MTSAQFALAVGADQMWIRNARRALGRPKRNDASEARWFGLVHDLHGSVGVALDHAARIADEAIVAPTHQGSIECEADPGMSIKVTLDLTRTRTLYELRLARALHLPVIDHRGRPATSYRPVVAELERRARRGSDPIRLGLSARRPAAERLAALGSMAELLVELSNAGVRFIVIGEVAGALLGTLRQPSEVDVVHDANDHSSVDVLAALLKRWRAHPRGADGSGPCSIDAAVIRSVPTLALDTDLSPVNFWTSCHVLGDYSATQAHVVSRDTSGLEFSVLDIRGLMAMARGQGRSRDYELMYELRQLGIERQRAIRFANYARSISSSSATTRV